MTSFQNRIRDQENLRTAKILGYVTEMDSLQPDSSFGPSRIRYADLTGELEDPRYFVVLMAFDFQKLWKDKERKVLWVTRFSIRARNNEFDRDLASMTRQAARFFGRDSNGLQRNISFRGSIRMGEVQVLEMDPKP